MGERGLMGWRLSLCVLLLVAHRARGEWHDAALPTSFKRLSSITMISPDRGWAGGRDGLFLAWNGTAWHRQTVPIQGDIVAMSFPSANLGWVAAYDIGSQQSTLYRFDGRQWTSIAVPLGVRATSLVLDDAHRVWLFGQGGRVLRYDGQSWRELLSPGYRTPLAARRGPTGELWAAGEFGTVWQWDGTDWKSIPVPVTSNLNAIAVHDTSDIWVAGDGGVILRRLHDRWIQLASPTTAHLYDVSVEGPNSIWFCGRDILLHWDGNEVWKDDASVHGDLRAIQVFPGGSGWSVGYGAVLRRIPPDQFRPPVSALGFYRQEILPNVLGVQGVAFGDVNGDGLDDLYLVSLRDANHLLLNERSGQFSDMTGVAGLMGTVATSPMLQGVAQYGAAWADYDNDGMIDLFVAGWYGSTRLYRQAQSGRFVDVTDRLPLDEGPFSANSAIFGDVNGDGRLDLFVTNEHGSNRLWINNGRGGWDDRTIAWGLGSRGGSKQAAFGDLDDDGDLDLYVCNWHAMNRVFRNDGSRFTDVSATCAAAGDTAQSNGVTFADFDNDGDLDIVVTSSGGRNRVWRNDGNWSFTDVSGIVGFASGPFSYGCAAADFDNDGDLDLIIVSNDGINYFENVGGLEFVSTVVEGLTDIRDARAVAVSDIDNDGDLDVFVGSRADLVERVSDFRQRRSACFINKLDNQGSITVRLRGVYGNRFGIGGRVSLYRAAGSSGGHGLLGVREISAGSGYYSQSSATAHFGVDTTDRYLVRVRFPGGSVVEVNDVHAGARITVREASGVAAASYGAARALWNWLWSDTVQRHVWPLVVVIPVLIWGIRTASQRLLWRPIWTTAFSVSLCVAYALLAAATVSTTGWIARLTPSLTIIGMVGIAVALSHWSGPRLSDRLAYRQRMEALAARANLTSVLSATMEPKELATQALNELARLFPIEQPKLCLCAVGGERVELVIPQGSWPGLSEGSLMPEVFRQLPAEERLMWDVPCDGEPPRGDWAPLCLSLVARQTNVGLIHGWVARRHVGDVMRVEPALRGFMAFVAMSLYNAQVQQQARARDAEYRAWLDRQARKTVASGRTVSPASAHRDLVRRLATIRKNPPLPPGSIESLIGESRLMQEVVRRVGQVAPADSSVLILGESGTGKELAARAIHGASKRSSGPFVAVNCGAIPQGLLESELFGHTRGAFTGAQAARSGVFQRANKGTIFLDEVAEMDLSAQVRLLRVLQERTVTPVGGEADLPVDVRVIAATHRDLAAAVAEGRFRDDLYYRLNVFPIHMPPLRERLEDLPALIAALLYRIAERTNVPIKGLSEDVMEQLLAHDWPGNVRELDNSLERAYLLAEGHLVRAEDLQFDLPAGNGERTSRAGDRSLVGRTLPDLEREVIEQTLRACDNNVSETARKLGVSRDILRYRIRKYGIGRTSDG